MNILEFIGGVLKPVRSDASMLLEAAPGISESPTSISLISPIFENGGKIPETHTADGAGFFPELQWKNLPEGTQSLALVVEDPDAPKVEPFVHAIVYNISPNSCVLARSTFASDNKNLSDDARTHGLQIGLNSMSLAECMPPAPPKGHGLHHYHFQLLALDGQLLFPEPPTLAQLRDALRDRVLACGEIVGTYER